MKNKEESSIFGKILAFIKIICIIILLLFIIVLLMQRFSNNETAVGGIRIFNVATESMVPKYMVGDVIIIKETLIDDLKVGDDVSYLGQVGSFNGKVVTHQIVEIEEDQNEKVFHTKGIANEVEDPTIKGDQIYGKVIYKCRIISMISKLANNIKAFYIIIFLPLGLLIFLQIKENIDSKHDERINDEDDEDDEEDDDDDEDDEDDE